MYYNGGNSGVASIIGRLAPGSPVYVWFDHSGFVSTYFQFCAGHFAAFSGGGFDGGLTYIEINKIQAIRVGH
ncbi:hypothetical protein [Alicyclobacillus ferrooxydans]|uniref:Uncharacterized protein n=1 Tax=Alicyclobacillus ferrooxydans TaxID=471514 RepID=A0A0P9EMJ5_9BACL|nr:hypothetical protein [Alicyclobacillus ferrooxydans]KPV44603.1 hypothetical protein AN477_06300 [Alicyclobacillus ferrooxydans]